MTPYNFCNFAFYLVESLLLLCSVVVAAISFALRWMPLKKLSYEEKNATKEGEIINAKSNFAASLMLLIKRHPRLDKTKTASDKNNNVVAMDLGDVTNNKCDLINNQHDVTTNEDAVIDNNNIDVANNSNDVTKIRSPQEDE